MGELIRALEWRPGGPGLNPVAATSLRNFGKTLKAVGPFNLVSMPGK